ncbi:hypothetical protein VB734_13625 [Synechococcus sp. BA-124 BA4]|uniref:hypothetical protein n=1 Tax=Synechococcus sp. BA-124 BA4 TaxID=3110251 RepID=UPI002B21DBB8|nr:hypothetical protein [Synechococcus sp. BA-124 BA4]MEA5401076.1 hypothetical protein [Synechococcus sp. BA-124 BA4]
MSGPDEFEARELTPLGVDQQRAAVAEVRQEWGGLLGGIEGLSPSGLDLDGDPL